MISSDDLIAQGLSGIPNVDLSIIGVFRSQVGPLCVVDVGDARISVPSNSAVPPIPGESVRLLRVNGLTVLMGPTVPRAPFGRVTVTGVDSATVEYPAGSGVTQIMAVPDGLVLAVNDNVRIDWFAGGVIAARYTITPVYVTPPAPVVVVGGRVTQKFTAVQAGSWGAAYGWNTPDVWASDSYTGAWFYGVKIADTIPDTAVIESARIYLPIRKNSGGNPIFGTHSSAYKPGGNVTFVSTAALTTRSGWVTVPVAYANYLKANYGGLGFDHGGFSIWNGIEGAYRDTESGALEITYTT